MAITRINNNQITDAVAGNAYVGVNAAAKIQAYSITSGKISNNLTYGSDLTVTGNLTVQGNVTAVDTVNLVVEDPLILLAMNQTGSPTLDIGFIGQRGTSTNIAWVWKESAGQFQSVYTSTTESNTTITVSSFADVKVGNFVAGGTTTLTGNVGLGNLSLSGNVTSSLNVTGNITGGNLLTPGLISSTGNITGGNVLAGSGIISTSGNITGGNVLFGSGVVSGTGNVSGNVGTFTTHNGTTFSASGNITGGNVLFGSGIVSGTGNITGNVVTATTLNSTTVSASGNITGGNVLFGSGIVSGTGNVTGNVITATTLNSTTVSASGNVTGGNVLFGSGIVSGTGNVSGNVGTFTTHNGTTFSASGNVTAASVVGGVITGTSTSVTGTTTAASVVGGVITGTSTSVTGTTTAASVVGGVITGTSTSVTGTTTAASVAGGVITGTSVSVSGNVTGGNVLAGSGVITTTGNITGGNVLFGSGIVSGTGNITGNVITGTTVNATSVSASGNVLTTQITGTTVTISATGGAITLSPSGNISASSKNINNVADPVAAQDAATKAYVDSVAQGLDVKASVSYATTANLAPYTYSNGTSGVGATLTATAVGNLTLDGTVVSAGQRILIKNETGAFVNNTTQSAAFNGIYTVTTAGAPGTAYVLTRATDFDQAAEMASAFTFVEDGTTLADTGWVCTTNNPITVGTTQITFTQFSGAGQYTGGNAISLTGTVINALYDGSTIGKNGSNQLYIPANAPLTTPNIGAATGTSLSVTGAVTSSSVVGGVITGTSVSVSGNVTGGNVLFGSGIVSGTGNISGNVLTATTLNATTVSASGNVTGGNVLAGSGIISSSGNVTGGNVLFGSGIVSGTGNISGNVGAFTTVNATTVSASGNVTGGNVLFGSGIVSGTGNINGNVLTATTLNATTVSASGNVTGGNVLFGSGIVSGTGNVSGNVGTFTTHNGTTFSASGTVTAASVVGGVITGSSTSVTGTTTAASVVGGVITGSSTSVTGTTTAASVVGGVITGTSLSVSGNVTGGNVLFGTGIVSGTGNITGNVVTGTTANLGNIRISVDNITTVGSNLTFNSAAGNINFRVSGTAANVLAVDAASNTVVIGSLTATAVTNAALNIATTNSIIIPVGSTAQRPAVPVTGMLRYNNSSGVIEYYTANAWTTAGTTFTVINADSFTGNGVQTAFTISQASTTAATIVAINGVVQQPTTAYAVSGTTLTFTEAPASSDIIDVRELTTTTTVTGLQNTSANAIFNGSNTAAQFDLTGSIIPTANATANLGSVTNQFNTVFAKATSAQYADLAEMYVADQPIEAGTVVAFGGNNEVTTCTVDASRRVAGVVSTNPSYLMNSGQAGEYVVPVALQGRVPVRVTGTVQKGDMMVATGDGRARTEANPAVGSVIGKALADFNGVDGVIEVVVGRV